MRSPFSSELASRRMATDTRSDVRFGGLADADLLELHRRMVLLRTYDERSVVYHRQGRIGTYAIFWNHEAIQAGATFALGDDDWIFPSYRESAIGLVRGLPAETILQWWRGHPSGWWNPGRLERRVDLGADRESRAARGRSRVGQEAARRERRRDGVLRRRRDERRRVPRRRQPRRRDERAGGVRLQQQPVGDLDAARGADARRVARRQGGRLRDSRRDRRRPRRARGLRRSARSRRARALRRRADADRVRPLPRRAARDRRRSECLHRPGARRGGAGERMCRPLRAAAARRRRPHRRAGGGARKDAEDLMRAGIAAAEAEPPADPELVFTHAYVDPPENMRNG